MKYSLTSFILLFSLTAHSEFNQDALNKTQAVLRDSSKRAEHIKATSPQTQQAIQMLRSMGMTKDQENALFDIAASSFGGMLKGVNGDTKKMQEMLSKGMSNPKAFLESMGGVHKSRIRDLSSQVESFNKNERK